MNDVNGGSRTSVHFAECDGVTGEGNEPIQEPPHQQHYGASSNGEHATDEGRHDEDVVPDNSDEEEMEPVPPSRSLSYYEALPEFTGEGWHMTARPLDPERAEEARLAGESSEDDVSCCCSIRYLPETGHLRVILPTRHVFEFRLFSFVIRAVMLVLLWVILWSLVPKGVMEPGGEVFDTALVVIVSFVVGVGVCHLLNMPELVGVVVVAIIWNNIPEVGYLTAGIKPMIRKSISVVGLSVILTRAGLGMNLGVLRKTLVNTLIFATFPFMAEATMNAVVANKVFSFNDYKWAFMQGFACSAVGPAVVVPGVLMLQKMGYGRTGGPNFLLISALSLDMILGIWGVPFISGLIFEPDRDLALAVALGPIQIVVGVLVGCCLGALHYSVMMFVFMKEATMLPVHAVSSAAGKKRKAHAASLEYARKHIQRTHIFGACLLFLLNLGALSLSSNYKFSGGGSFSVICCSAVSGHLLSTSTDPHAAKMKHSIAAFFASLWDFLVMPALFSMAGSSVVLSQIFNGEFFLKAIACVLLGILARFLASLLCPVGLKYTNDEKIYLGLGWLGKGAVQGAVAVLPFLRAEEELAANPDSESAQIWFHNAKIVKDVAILSLLVGTPFSAICMSRLGPKLLKLDSPSS